VLGAIKTVRHYDAAAGVRYLDATKRRVTELEERIKQAEQTRLAHYVEAARTLRMYEGMADKSEGAAQKVAQCQQDMERLGPVTEAQIEEYRRRIETLEKARDQARSAQEALLRIRGGRSRE
jgi:chromosome segregation ATPase